MYIQLVKWTQLYNRWKEIKFATIFKAQFEKAKGQFTVHKSFLGFWNLIHGWFFLDVWIHWWCHWVGWCCYGVIGHVDIARYLVSNSQRKFCPNLVQAAKSVCPRILYWWCFPAAMRSLSTLGVTVVLAPRDWESGKGMNCNRLSLFSSDTIGTWRIRVTVLLPCR